MFCYVITPGARQNTSEYYRLLIGSYDCVILGIESSTDRPD